MTEKIIFLKIGFAMRTSRNIYGLVKFGRWITKNKRNNIEVSGEKNTIFTFLNVIDFSRILWLRPSLHNKGH